MGGIILNGVFFSENWILGNFKRDWVDFDKERYFFIVCKFCWSFKRGGRF